MKIKTLVAVLFLSAGATTVVAQDDANCNSNSSISHEAVKAGNFKDAYTPWKAVLENCPTLRFYTFTDGYKILKGLLGQIKDRNSAEYKKYFDELMNTHDLRMKYTQEFLGKGVKVSSEDEALGIKAVDYIAFAPKVDVNQAYDWLKKSVDAAKAESAAATLFYFLQMSHDKLKEDPAHKEQFIQDYLAASEYADDAIAAADKESVKKAFGGIKDNLVALFINSGTADCESLQGIYGPKVETNQTDLNYLKKVISIMKMMKCTDSDAYQQASFYVYKIEPSAEAATGCAYQAFKKGDIDSAVKFFDEAVNLETDNLKKAEKAYAAAAVLALSVSLTAFAAPSTNISGVVTVDTKDNGVDGNGNTITASLAEVPAEYQSAVADVRKPETLKALLGSAYTDTMSVVDVKDVTVADGTVFPVTIRFNVPGVTTSTKVAVLHYDTEKKAWEVVDSKAGQGTITATFNSLSPVAFVVDKSTSASTTSPQTGEHSMVVLFGAVAVVAACGAVGLSRKKRA